MIGTLYNCAFIIAGALLGYLLRSLLNRRITDALLQIAGVCTLIVAVKISLRFENILLVMSCLILGGALGSAIQLESLLERWLLKIQSYWFKERGDNASKRKEKMQVVINTSVLFCTGAMAILGAIESQLRGDHQILITKGILDGLFTITLTTVYGPVLALTFVPVLIYQSSIALFAAQLDYLSQPAVLNDLSGVGGVLLAMIALSILNIKKFPFGDFLPAIFIYIFYTGVRFYFF